MPLLLVASLTGSQNRPSTIRQASLAVKDSLGATALMIAVQHKRLDVGVGRGNRLESVCLLM